MDGNKVTIDVFFKYCMSTFFIRPSLEWQEQRAIDTTGIPIFCLRHTSPPPLTLPSPNKLKKPIEEFFTYSLSDLLTAVYDPVATR